MVTRGVFSVVLSFLSFLWILNRGDAEVCVLANSCILTCSFRPGSDVVIHWVTVKGERPVHAFYHDQDQLARQDPQFRGRTSLFKDQIANGNASLRLTGVKFQDVSEYKCYTSTINGNKEQFVTLDVEAPVREVHIEQVETRITCSSEGIYPEPKLTWSTDPPSSEDLQTSTTVQPTEQQLYNISSSLMVPGGLTDPVYICTVSNGRNQRRSTLRQQPPISVCSSAPTIPCTQKTAAHLTWRFNHRQTILTRTRTDDTFRVSEEWRPKVKSVSESGSLTLQDLSTDQEGTYTCELSDEEETNMADTNLLTINDCSTKHAAVAAGVIVLVLLGLVGLVVFWRCRNRRRGSGERRNGQTVTGYEPGGSESADEERTSINDDSQMNGALS